MYFKTGCYAQRTPLKGNSSSEYMAVVQQQNSLLLGPQLIVSSRASGWDLAFMT
jgi:hypothetical protein